MFKFFSETNNEVKKFLRPDLGLRSWNDLSAEEKNKIWHYLRPLFFDAQKEESILYLNKNYKTKSFAMSYLENPSLKTACYDFHEIFINQTEAVVMELLSAYSIVLYEYTKNIESVYKHKEENDDNFLQRKIKIEYGFFDVFAEKLNDVFLQFGIKHHLTRDGFILRQEEKIIEEIYQPVLSYLSDPKWKKVNEILSDAFSDYRKNTPQGYSGCVTKTISAVEAYLQILVDGKTGGKKLSSLITEVQRNNLILSDIFTKTIFNNIESIFARERKATGDAHPKDEYATERNTRTILNLAMIFIQHCIQK